MRPIQPIRPLRVAANQAAQVRVWLARGESWWRDEWMRLRPQIALVWRFIRERWKTLWLHTHPVQAVAEALVPQALALVWAVVIMTSQVGGGARASLWTNHRRRLHQWRRQPALGRLSDAAGGALAASPPDQPRRRVRAGHRADDHPLVAGTSVSLGVSPHKSGRCPYEARPPTFCFLATRCSGCWCWPGRFSSCERVSRC